jgi:hypothetical protein
MGRGRDAELAMARELQVTGSTTSLSLFRRVKLLLQSSICLLQKKQKQKKKHTLPEDLCNDLPVSCYDIWINLLEFWKYLLQCGWVIRCLCLQKWMTKGISTSDSEGIILWWTLLTECHEIRIMILSSNTNIGYVNTCFTNSDKTFSVFNGARKF